MKFIATEDVAEFKEGDEVPQGRALIWLDMYDVPPVKKVELEEVKEAVKTDEKTVKKESTKERVSDNNFKEKLKEIKGIGKATTEDIIRVYPSEKKLKEAISEGDKLPFREDVVILLKKNF